MLHVVHVIIPSCTINHTCKYNPVTSYKYNHWHPTLGVVGCTELIPRMLDGVCPGWLVVMMAVGLPVPPAWVVTNFTIVAPCGIPLFCKTQQ